MSMPKPTVFVIDDDVSVLTALARLLAARGYETRTFSSPSAFLEAHDPDFPGCAIVDVAMPGLNGLELQAALKGSDGAARPIIFVTGRGDISTSVRAMKGGAIDFLTKPIDETTLLDVVAAAIEQDRSSRADWMERTDLMGRYSLLTMREREVLSHVVAGRLNKQIAADLGIAEKTIKLHRGRVMSKMKVRSLAELVRLSNRLGLDLPLGR
ncbi:response regulator [Mesorhizobium sp. YR577]|uniref:response regulator transcription factor n=1 Tax=Mesorhizobium sp. YR577 TaxID=1884373 RepID=UPI0008DECEFA|nr:response regulator [Mesorhizobium sp. YR577]SFU22646.1 two component transcriptional regulator, LuxR family [Mesorhizobium sp. YR577]